ncbi:hypothetical protein GLYMA_06G252433v4 [Glycine max]|nr:hypothetical protein GLYMA_06G252433v4 [Glycine max]KAH1127546.1 hypothetical protein GYH30_016232 [Glycine max]
MSRCILSHVLAFALVSALSVFSCLVNVAQAQSANTTTDPSEGECFLVFFFYVDKEF